MAKLLALAPWHWHWPQTSVDLLVAERAASLLCSHCQGPRDVEKGGQLFVDIDDPRGLVLSVATPPHRDDRAGVFWLELDPARCRKEVQEWHSKGLYLLGVWHTHAERIPSLSRQDLKSLHAYGLANRFWPLAIVVGQGSSPLNVRAWSLREGAPLLARLTQPNFAGPDAGMNSIEICREGPK